MGQTAARPRASSRSTSIHALRLEEAKQMLEIEDLSVEAIANWLKCIFGAEAAREVIARAHS